MDLLKVAQSYHKKSNIAIAADLSRESGLLRTMQFAKSSHLLYDKDSLQTVLPSGEFYSPGGGVTPSSGGSKIVTTELFPFGMVQEVASALIDDYDGGLKQYILDKAPSYTMSAGQAIAEQYIYGFGTGGDAAGFKGIRQMCIDAGNVAKPAGSAVGSTSSIYIVKWDTRIMTGLYPDKMFKESMVKFKILNNGLPVLIEDPADSDKKLSVYQFSLDLKLGLKALVANNVYQIYNLKDSATFYPTIPLITAGLQSVKATAASTKIYCNSTVKGFIDDLKATVYHRAQDTEMSLALETIKNIEIVVDDNISNTETGVGVV